MNGSELDGLLLVDKPAGPTSHDVVDAVRRATRQRRIGHAGTLDPPASGLLPLVLGRATRLVRFLPHSPKEYRGVIRLGRTTLTDDAAGEVVSSHVGPLPEPATVLAAALELEGPSRQVPPAVSARKVAGTRLYRWVRRGMPITAPATDVVVERFLLVSTDHADRYEFTTVVSAGTYVRALVRDLGQRLGCGAIVESLRRTAIGPWQVEEAVGIPGDPAAARAALISLERMPLELPSCALAAPLRTRRFRSGGIVQVEPSGTVGPCRVVDDAGRLLGIGQRDSDRLRPIVVLFPPDPSAEEARDGPRPAIASLDE